MLQTIRQEISIETENQIFCPGTLMASYMPIRKLEWMRLKKKKKKKNFFIGSMRVRIKAIYFTSLVHLCDVRMLTIIEVYRLVYRNFGVLIREWHTFQCFLLFWIHRDASMCPKYTIQNVWYKGYGAKFTKFHVCSILFIHEFQVTCTCAYFATDRCCSLRKLLRVDSVISVKTYYINVLRTLFDEKNKHHMSWNTLDKFLAEINTDTYRNP